MGILVVCVVCLREYVCARVLWLALLSFHRHPIVPYRVWRRFSN